MKKILVLGASGFIGTAVCEALSPEYQIFGTYHTNKTRPQNTMMIYLDLSKEDSITNLLETVEPDLVISSLRGDYVHQLNAHDKIADYLRHHGGRLIYFSTANVFDALTDKAHIESDLPSATSDYGKFKIKCEDLLKSKLGPLVTIIRLPMIFGKDSKRVHAILDGIKKGAPLIVYRDMFISIHSDRLLAKQIAYLVDQGSEGTIHLGSYDVVKYDEAYALLVKHLGYPHTRLQYERIQEQPYYLALKSEKNRLPIDLIYSAETILNNL